MNLDDTIVAIATPAGRGGIGVVRLAGPDALPLAGVMLRLLHPLEPRRATFADLIQPGDAATSTFAPGEKIDEVVVTWFQKPHSYTTDDIVEIAAHGAPIVLRHIVELALGRGARLAEPGEFTLRAFLNGRLDLTQAEAVRDLIESRTLYQAKVAAQQLEGALAHRLRPIKQELVELIALLEAGVDFAEDDVAVLPAAQILERLARVRAPLEQLAASFAYGKVVHEGLTLAIVGRPNVGKSSLFNRLAERDRAIVTATPGTTRDLVTETVAIGGIPVRLVDTAGLRPATDEAESIGVKKTLEAIADADVVLVVTDLVSLAGDTEAAKLDLDLEERTRGRKRILVANKCDLAPAGSCSAGRPRPASRSEAPELEPPAREDFYDTSALTGQGIAELRTAILQAIGGEAAEHESGFLTNARHQSLVGAALNALANAVRAAEQKLPHEMLLLDLYSALRPLDEITGATTADDILNLIFSTFCIGK